MKLHKKSAIECAIELSRGVFWVIDDDLLAFPFIEPIHESGISKSGLTYNHERLWPIIKPNKCNKAYNYYPRGRVEINNRGESTVYMNPNVDDKFIAEIKRQFGLRDNTRIIYVTANITNVI